MAADKKSDGIMSGCSDDLSTNLEEMMTQERRDFSNCNENWLRLQDEMHSEAAAAISDEDELRAAIALSLDNNYGQAALKPWSSSVKDFHEMKIKTQARREHSNRTENLSLNLHDRVQKQCKHFQVPLDEDGTLVEQLYEAKDDVFQDSKLGHEEGFQNFDVALDQFHQRPQALSADPQNYADIQDLSDEDELSASIALSLENVQGANKSSSADDDCLPGADIDDTGSCRLESDSEMGKSEGECFTHTHSGGKKKTERPNLKFPASLEPKALIHLHDLDFSRLGSVKNSTSRPRARMINPRYGWKDVSEVNPKRYMSGPSLDAMIGIFEMGKKLVLNKSYSSAVFLLEKARDMSVSAGNKRVEAYFSNYLGNLYMQVGSFDLSLQRQNRCLEISQNLGDLKAEAISFQGIGIVYMITEQHDQAIGMFEKALELFKRIGNVRGEILVYENLSRAHKLLGRDDSASETLRHASNLKKCFVRGNVYGDLDVKSTYTDDNTKLMGDKESPTSDFIGSDDSSDFIAGERDFAVYREQKLVFHDLKSRFWCRVSVWALHRHAEDDILCGREMLLFRSKCVAFLEDAGWQISILIRRIVFGGVRDLDAAASDLDKRDKTVTAKLLDLICEDEQRLTAQGDLDLFTFCHIPKNLHPFERFLQTLSWLIVDDFSETRERLRIIVDKHFAADLESRGVYILDMAHALYEDPDRPLCLDGMDELNRALGIRLQDHVRYGIDHTVRRRAWYNIGILEIIDVLIRVPDPVLMKNVSQDEMKSGRYFEKFLPFWRRIATLAAQRNVQNDLMCLMELRNFEGVIRSLETAGWKLQLPIENMVLHGVRQLKDFTSDFDKLHSTLISRILNLISEEEQRFSRQYGSALLTSPEISASIRPFERLLQTLAWLIVDDRSVENENYLNLVAVHFAADLQCRGIFIFDMVHALYNDPNKTICLESMDELNYSIGTRLQEHMHCGTDGEAKLRAECNLETLKSLRTPSCEWSKGGQQLRIAERLVVEGNHVEACSLLEKVRLDAVRLRDLQSEAYCCQLYGRLYQGLNQYQRSMSMFSESQLLFQKISDRRGEAVSICGLAAVHHALGQYGMALKLMNTALTMFQEKNDSEGLAMAYTSMGKLNASLCRHDLALENFDLALRFCTGDTKDLCKAHVYRCLGSTHVDLGQNEQALEVKTTAFEFFKSSGDEGMECQMLLEIGEIYFSLGQIKWAQELLEMCIVIARRRHNARCEAVAHLDKGRIFHFVHQYNDALDSLEYALNALSKIEDVFAKYNCHRVMGAVYMDMNMPELAARSFEEALISSETLQKNMLENMHERVSLFEKLRECYILLMASLIQNEKYDLAFAVSERSKARSLNYYISSRFKQFQESSILETSRNSGFYALDCWNDTCRMVKEEGRLVLGYSVLNSHTLACWVVSSDGVCKAFCATDIRAIFGVEVGSIPELICRLHAVLDVPNRSNSMCRFGSADIDIEVSEIAAEWIRNVRKHLCLIFSESPQYFYSVNRRTGSARKLTCVFGKIGAVSGKGAEMLRELQHDTESYGYALHILESQREIECFLDKIFIEVVDNLKLQELYEESIAQLNLCFQAVKMNTWRWPDLVRITDDQLLAYGVINRQVRKLFLAEISLHLNEEVILSQLYRILIAPMEDVIRDIEDLLIVPDLQLAKVPWAALRDEHGIYLMERHVISVTPSLLTARNAASRAESEQYENPKIVVVGNPWPLAFCNFDSLPEAEEEACSVAVKFQSFSTTLLKGSNASNSSVYAALSHSNVVHLACHCWLERNSLVLCPASDKNQEGLLSMEEIQDSVILAPKSIVVLSACNSGMGTIMGEGVIGISRAFMSAGAGTILASLWSIGDQSTRKLMEAIYVALFEGCNVSQALRFAMLMMRKHSEEGQRSVRSWAGFISVGTSVQLPPVCWNKQHMRSWNVEQVSSLFAQCGLPIDLILDNEVDGKTFISLSDAEVMKELALSAEELARLRAKQISMERKSGYTHVFDLSYMEQQFNDSCPTWFMK